MNQTKSQIYKLCNKKIRNKIYSLSKIYFILSGYDVSTNNNNNILF